MFKFNSFVATILATFLFLFALGVGQAQAVDIGLGQDGLASKVGEQGGYSVDVTDTTFSESVGKGIKIALSLVGTVFLTLTVYAGILWMTASGNEEKVEKSRNILQRAIIGLIITLAAYGITVFILVAITYASGEDARKVGADQGEQYPGWRESFTDNWQRFVF
jgi:TRAP-type C4-dicarboxylate transport system permease small subunit